jgi:peptidyl-prolyl cis-trans isomerase B (cyclophilin B)
MVARMSNSKRPKRPVPVKRQGMPNGQKAIVAGIVLVCVAALIAIPLLLNSGGDDDESASAAASKPSPTSVDDVTCDKAPEGQSEGKTYPSPPPASLSENATWEATIHTTCGDIRVELDGKAAPQTVASFIFLARDGYWNDGGCHRLTTEESGIFVLQCGDPTGTGSVAPPYGFGVENAPPDGDFPRGTLAMARGDDPNSNGGQFFFVYQDTQLPADPGYSIFGKVTQGMDIVDAVAQQGVGTSSGAGDGAPKQPISILSVDVAKKT